MDSSIVRIIVAFIVLGVFYYWLDQKTKRKF